MSTHLQLNTGVTPIQLPFSEHLLKNEAVAHKRRVCTLFIIIRGMELRLHVFFYTKKCKKDRCDACGGISENNEKQSGKA
ncbi:hypothetical protein B5Z21_00580 [Bacillus velezensis]|nr:hypothetical protein B5Z21_00580 [Bacillus velezensis]